MNTDEHGRSHGEFNFRSSPRGGFLQCAFRVFPCGSVASQRGNVLFAVIAVAQHTASPKERCWEDAESESQLLKC